MKSITIKGSQRESVGKVATKALRNAGHGSLRDIRRRQANCIFQQQKKHLRSLVYTPNVYTATIDVRRYKK